MRPDADAAGQQAIKKYSPVVTAFAYTGSVLLTSTIATVGPFVLLGVGLYKGIRYMLEPR